MAVAVEQVVGALRALVAAHGDTWDVVDALDQRFRPCRCAACQQARVVLQQHDAPRGAD